MAHNVLSYGSPEAARRANRAINKIAQDGGFVGVKPTERRVHTAVAGQGTVEYNGYFKIVDITEYYDADGKEISKPEYKIRVCDGMNQGSLYAGICQVNTTSFQINVTELVLDFSENKNKFIYLRSVDQETSSEHKNEGELTMSFEIVAEDNYLDTSVSYEVFYLIGEASLVANTMTIVQRHGTTSFPGNGIIFVLKFAKFSCEN